MVKYAAQVSEIINAFSMAALKTNEMDKFYCDDTMEYRTSDKYNSPIEDIFDGCINPGEYNAFLLLGHRGCGKSTELNKMSLKLTDKGYHVKTINCSLDLDLLNIVHSDLFILMGEALLQIAKETGCNISKNILENIRDFWHEGTETITAQETEAASMETGISIETKGIFANILNIFSEIKTDLKLNEEVRKEYHKKISIRFSEWIKILGHVSDEIARHENGRRPVIIFEDLDKLNPEDAWRVFYNYAAVLSGMDFPVIYTFPISLSYDIKFSAMESYFITKTLPMIKIEKTDGTSFDEGINIIYKILLKW